MSQHPTGEVALVFTDVQGSSAIWDALGRDCVPILALHDAAMRAEIARFSGYEVSTAGDSFFVAFAHAREALGFCMAAQERLASVDWPAALTENPALAAIAGADDERGLRGLRVRMGVHTGEPWIRRDPTTGRMDYGGPTTNRASRVSSAAHGGQVLLSGTAWQQIRDDVDAGFELTDLGEHALRGLAEPERIHQALPAALRDRRFPPIRTVDVRKTNVAPRLDSFVGRSDELAELGDRLERGDRLITVMGPGGTGKTRLAEQLARLQLGAFSGGAWLCDLTEGGGGGGRGAGPPPPAPPRARPRRGARPHPGGPAARRRHTRAGGRCRPAG